MSISGPLVHRLQIDIIIPALNEAAQLGRALASIGLPAQQNITVTVVDGGSRDATLDIACALGAAVLSNVGGGRGAQLRAGFEAGRGEIVLMLHADAVLPAGALACIRAAFGASPHVEWGVLGVRFDGRRPVLRALEWLNDARFRWFGIAFGDQGIVARRSSLEACGGIPALPLMEDVELSMRLRRGRGRLHLARPLVASTRRWERRSVVVNAVRALSFCVRYLALRQRGCDINRLASRLYASYYGRHVR